MRRRGGCDVGGKLGSEIKSGVSLGNLIAQSTSLPLLELRLGYDCISFFIWGLEQISILGPVN